VSGGTHDPTADARGRDVPRPLDRDRTRNLENYADPWRGPDDKLLDAREPPVLLTVRPSSRHIAGELRWVRRGSKKLVNVRELEVWLEREAARTLECARVP